MKKNLKIEFASGDDFFLTLEYKYLGNDKDGYFEQYCGEKLDFDLNGIDINVVIGLQKWARYKFLKDEDKDFNRDLP